MTKIRVTKKEKKGKKITNRFQMQELLHASLIEILYVSTVSNYCVRLREFTKRSQL
jgi:hypothetical protein